MKWFHLITCDKTVENPLVIDKSNLHGIEREDLVCGNSVDGWKLNSWLQATDPENDGDPDDALQNFLGVPVYSERLVTALLDAGIAGIQFLPVRVLKPSGELAAKFKIANIVEIRKALDMESSDFDVFPADYFLERRRGRIRGIRRAVLISKALNGCDIIRLEEYKEAIYVSERFKDVFVEGQFTGSSFVEVGTR